MDQEFTMRWMFMSFDNFFQNCINKPIINVGHIYQIDMCNQEDREGLQNLCQQDLSWKCGRLFILKCMAHIVVKHITTCTSEMLTKRLMIHRYIVDHNEP